MQGLGKAQVLRVQALRVNIPKFDPLHTAVGLQWYFSVVNHQRSWLGLQLDDDHPQG